MQALTLREQRSDPGGLVLVLSKQAASRSLGSHGRSPVLRRFSRMVRYTRDPAVPYYGDHPLSPESALLHEPRLHERRIVFHGFELSGSGGDPMTRFFGSSAKRVPVHLGQSTRSVDILAQATLAQPILVSRSSQSGSSNDLGRECAVDSLLTAASPARVF